MAIRGKTTHYWGLSSTPVARYSLYTKAAPNWLIDTLNISSPHSNSNPLHLVPCLHGPRNPQLRGVPAT